MLIKVGDFEFTEVLDGVLLKKRNTELSMFYSV